MSYTADRVFSTRLGGAVLAKRCRSAWAAVLRRLFPPPPPRLRGEQVSFDLFKASSRLSGANKTSERWSAEAEHQ